MLYSFFSSFSSGVAVQPCMEWIPIKKKRKNKCTVSIIAGSLGHWIVNKESKIVEILLRSCYKGMNKNNMSKSQKVKFKQYGMRY